MKKLLIPSLICLLTMTVLDGCAWSVGSDTKSVTQPTVGQQLLDLQKAKDSGAMTDTEYQAQKTKVLNAK